VYIIMELLAGGELLTALLDKGKGADGTEAHYSEADARVIFRQLLGGVKYMHDTGIVHRDLKLENLLLSKPGDIGTIKIADFGLAKSQAAALSTICGTPQYVAPEVIQGGREPYTYGAECDLWSCGVILFILLGGYPPFYDESEPRLFKKIREGRYDMVRPAQRRGAAGGGRPQRGANGAQRAGCACAACSRVDAREAGARVLHL
jgi:serine/threonine protein kinase